jgi:predicted small secreted protein
MMKKRIIAVVLAGAFCLFFAACPTDSGEGSGTTHATYVNAGGNLVTGPGQGVDVGYLNHSVIVDVILSNGIITEVILSGDDFNDYEPDEGINLPTQAQKDSMRAQVIAANSFKPDAISGVSVSFTKDGVLRAGKKALVNAGAVVDY